MHKSLCIKAELSKLDQATDFVSGCAEELGVAPARIMGLTVALEEAFVNICNYAYPEKSGDVELTCSVAGEYFALEISDHGVPFDLLSLAEPDTSASIEDRDVGGLGILLLRKFTDDVSYCREKDCNKLTIRIHLNKEKT